MENHKMHKLQGFFAYIDNHYVGPYERLNQARDEARPCGNNIPIYYGILERSDDGEIECNHDLVLIPKCQKDSKNGK